MYDTVQIWMLLFIFMLGEGCCTCMANISGVNASIVMIFLGYEWKQISQNKILGVSKWNKLR